MTKITEEIFGKIPGGVAALFTLDNGTVQVKITNLGGAVVSVVAPNNEGKPADVVLGFDSAADYLTHGGCLGAIVGRVANRIEKGQFDIGGKIYQLSCNDGKNHLHGGNVGFDRKLWDAKIDGEALVLTYTSADGEENYPGTLETTVTYTLDSENRLGIDYRAVSDKDTLVNLTNHSYFNLCGQGSGDVLNHRIKIYAEEYTPINSEVLPSGEIAPVAGTVYDLREFTRIGDRIDADEAGMRSGGGFDHNWVVGRLGDDVHLVCEAEGGGRTLKTYTNMPGMQFYSGNALEDGVVGKCGAIYFRRGGFCLETQFFPNAAKHKHFPSPILKAGEVYAFKTEYQFGIQ